MARIAIDMSLVRLVGRDEIRERRTSLGVGMGERTSSYEERRAVRQAAVLAAVARAEAATLAVEAAATVYDELMLLEENPPLLKTKKEKVEYTQQLVARVFGIDSAWMISKANVYAAARPRGIAMHLCKNLWGMCLAETGRQFKCPDYPSGRDRTTVRSSIEVVLNLLRTDAEFAHTVVELERHITAIKPPPE